MSFFDQQEQLLARRMVSILGPLDGATVSEASALMMTLDGRSSRPVELLINSEGGQLHDVVPLLDVMKVMRAKVDVTCLGSAYGTAAIVVACSSGLRSAGGRARLSLRCPPSGVPENAGTTADDLARHAEMADTLRTGLIEMVAAASGQPTSDVAAAFDRGEFLSAAEAIEVGLIDEIRGGRS